MNEHKTANPPGFLFRILVGTFIGAGFIVPGISGGALAAIFGIYEHIIKFLANLTKNFKENVLYFIPVGIGAIIGVVICAYGVSYALAHYEAIVMWFFVGAIVGSAPALWKEAGKKGRHQHDMMMLVAAFIVGIVILGFGQHLIGGKVAPSFGAWILSGALIALGILIPGMSPSNFIVFMGLYEKMSDGLKTLDLSVVLPLALGGLLTIILFAKLIERLFQRYYSLFFHFIFGVVLASTVMIIPTSYPNFGLLQYGMCFIMLVAGSALGWWMSKLEETYK